VAKGIDRQFSDRSYVYQNLIVRTCTRLAQLLPVHATVLGSELSTMIIISPHMIRVGADVAT
jgi:hypothetical protein